jgi:hypothetical protein
MLILKENSPNKDSSKKKLSEKDISSKGLNIHVRDGFVVVVVNFILLF